jgi:hypothetical protein
MDVQVPPIPPPPNVPPTVPSHGQQPRSAPWRMSGSAEPGRLTARWQAGMVLAWAAFFLSSIAIHYSANVIGKPTWLQEHPIALLGSLLLTVAVAAVVMVNSRWALPISAGAAVAFAALGLFELDNAPGAGFSIMAISAGMLLVTAAAWTGRNRQAR